MTYRTHSLHRLAGRHCTWSQHPPVLSALCHNRREAKIFIFLQYNVLNTWTRFIKRTCFFGHVWVIDVSCSRLFKLKNSKESLTKIKLFRTKDFKMLPEMLPIRFIVLRTFIKYIMDKIKWNHITLIWKTNFMKYIYAITHTYCSIIVTLKTMSTQCDCVTSVHCHLAQ